LDQEFFSNLLSVHHIETFSCECYTLELICRRNSIGEEVVVVIKYRSGRSDPVGIFIYKETLLPEILFGFWRTLIIKIIKNSYFILIINIRYHLYARYLQLHT